MRTVPLGPKAERDILTVAVPPFRRRRRQPRRAAVERPRRLREVLRRRARRRVLLRRRERRRRGAERRRRRRVVDLRRERRRRFFLAMAGFFLVADALRRRRRRGELDLRLRPFFAQYRRRPVGILPLRTLRRRLRVTEARAGRRRLRRLPAQYLASAVGILPLRALRRRLPGFFFWGGSHGGHEVGCDDLDALRRIRTRALPRTDRRARRRAGFTYRIGIALPGTRLTMHPGERMRGTVSISTRTNRRTHVNPLRSEKRNPPRGQRGGSLAPMPSKPQTVIGKVTDYFPFPGSLPLRER